MAGGDEVGVLVADSREGACSGFKPSGRCLKRLIGSLAMANDAMDLQGKAGARGGRAVTALLVFVFAHCVCGWVPRVQKNAISCLSVEVPKIYR